MASAEQILEQLAAAAISIGENDLQELGRLHTQFEELKQILESASAPAAPIAGEAAGLIEKIILRETSDSAAAISQIGQTVERIRSSLAGGTCAVMEAPTAVIEAAPAVHAAPAAVHAAPAAAEQPFTIGAEDAPLVVEFIGEAKTHIESAESFVLRLEDQPDDAEAINAVFRSFHTIKGVAGFLNLKEIGSLAHAAENLLDKARKNLLRLSSATVDVVLEAIDQMKSLVGELDEAVRTNRPIGSHPAMASLLGRLHDGAEGKLTESQPKASATPTQAAAAGAPMPAAGSPQPAEGGSAASAAGGASAAGAGSAAGGASSGGAAAEATVKVATDRLDNLINMVGELVIAESMVRQDVASHLDRDLRMARDVSHLGKITRALQELSMAMRMVPIQGVFQKMARLVRDLSRKACKEVELVLRGGETELDRNVVESIGDPLVHMVRNAVDHGIESPEQRAAAGKPALGRVELKASQQAGNIVIQITDDGRGLNRQKIVQKAIAAGLVRADQELSDAEAFSLIFAPGLSTAEKVTDISGRGVGMDVVKRNIEALRGRVEIASTPGKGSVFTIRLPLTLAVIDGLIVQVGTHRYILPLTSIEQSVRPSGEMLSTVQSRGEMVNVRGSLLPLFRLHRLFGVEPKYDQPTSAIVVVVQDNGRRCGLMVDELLGQQQVVIKSLGEAVGTIKGVSGGAILGDGNVSLILDVPGLVQAATGN